MFAIDFTPIVVTVFIDKFSSNNIVLFLRQFMMVATPSLNNWFPDMSSFLTILFICKVVAIHFAPILVISLCDMLSSISVAFVLR